MYMVTAPVVPKLVSLGLCSPVQVTVLYGYGSCEHHARGH